MVIFNEHVSHKLNAFMALSILEQRREQVTEIDLDMLQDRELPFGRLHNNSSITWKVDIMDMIKR